MCAARDKLDLNFDTTGTVGKQRNWLMRQAVVQGKQDENIYIGLDTLQIKGLDVHVLVRKFPGRDGRSTFEYEVDGHAPNREAQGQVSASLRLMLPSGVVGWFVETLVGDKNFDVGVRFRYTGSAFQKDDGDWVFVEKVSSLKVDMGSSWWTLFGFAQSIVNTWGGLNVIVFGQLKQVIATLMTPMATVDEANRQADKLLDRGFGFLDKSNETLQQFIKTFKFGGVSMQLEAAVAGRQKSPSSPLELNTQIKTKLLCEQAVLWEYAKLLTESGDGTDFTKVLEDFKAKELNALDGLAAAAKVQLTGGKKGVGLTLSAPVDARTQKLDGRYATGLPHLLSIVSTAETTKTLVSSNVGNKQESFLTSTSTAYLKQAPVSGDSSYMDFTIIINFPGKYTFKMTYGLPAPSADGQDWDDQEKTKGMPLEVVLAHSNLLPVGGPAGDANAKCCCDVVNETAKKEGYGTSRSAVCTWLGKKNLDTKSRELMCPVLDLGNGNNLLHAPANDEPDLLLLCSEAASNFEEMIKAPPTGTKLLYYKNRLQLTSWDPRFPTWSQGPSEAALLSGVHLLVGTHALRISVPNSKWFLNERKLQVSQLLVTPDEARSLGNMRMAIPRGLVSFLMSPRTWSPGTNSPLPGIFLDVGGPVFIGVEESAMATLTTIKGGTIIRNGNETDLGGPVPEKFARPLGQDQRAQSVQTLLPGFDIQVNTFLWSSPETPLVILDFESELIINVSTDNVLRLLSDPDKEVDYGYVYKSSNAWTDRAHNKEVFAVLNCGEVRLYELGSTVGRTEIDAHTVAKVEDIDMCGGKGTGVAFEAAVRCVKFFDPVTKCLKFGKQGYWSEVKLCVSTIGELEVWAEAVWLQKVRFDNDPALTEKWHYGAQLPGSIKPSTLPGTLVAPLAVAYAAR